MHFDIKAKCEAWMHASTLSIPRKDSLLDNAIFRFSPFGDSRNSLAAKCILYNSAKDETVRQDAARAVRNALIDYRTEKKKLKPKSLYTFVWEHNQQLHASTSSQYDTLMCQSLEIQMACCSKKTTVHNVRLLNTVIDLSERTLQKYPIARPPLVWMTPACLQDIHCFHKASLSLLNTKQNPGLQSPVTRKGLYDLCQQKLQHCALLSKRFTEVVSLSLILDRDTQSKIHECIGLGFYFQILSSALLTSNEKSKDIVLTESPNSWQGIAQDILCGDKCITSGNITTILQQVRALHSFAKAAKTQSEPDVLSNLDAIEKHLDSMNQMVFFQRIPPEKPLHSLFAV